MALDRCQTAGTAPRANEDGQLTTVVPVRANSPRSSALA